MSIPFRRGSEISTRPNEKGLSNEAVNRRGRRSCVISTVTTIVRPFLYYRTPPSLQDSNPPIYIYEQSRLKIQSRRGA